MKRHSKQPSVMRAPIEKVKKDIAQKEKKLDRYENIYEFPFGSGGVKGTPRGRHRPGGLVNFDPILRKLPRKFTVDDFARLPALKSKSRVKLEKILLLLVTENKLEYLGAGWYKRPS